MEWKEERLGNLCIKIGSGATPSGGKEAYQGGDYHLVRSQNVLDFSFSNAGLASINEEQASKLKNVELYEGDVLLNITGDSVARACIVPNDILPARVNQHVAIIRADKKKLDNLFLLYYLQYKKNKLLQIASGGATRQAITKGMLESFEICFPSLDVQRRIADILSSLDRKIELNNKINAQLEEMAQTLFKHWFVDFGPFKDGKFVESELGMIPEGWRVDRLDSAVVIKRGGSPRPIQDYLSKEGLRWLKISDATAEKSPFIVSIAEHIKESGLNKTVFLKKGNLVLSNSATPGLPKFLCLDTCIHDGWLYFPQSSLPKEFLYFLFLKERDILISKGNGSVFTNLKTDIVKEMRVAFAPNRVYSAFEEIVSPIFEQIENSVIESLRLAQLRDTLLPKLMSGEIEL